MKVTFASAEEQEEEEEKDSEVTTGKNHRWKKTINLSHREFSSSFSKGLYSLGVCCCSFSFSLFLLSTWNSILASFLEIDSMLLLVLFANTVLLKIK